MHFLLYHDEGRHEEEKMLAVVRHLADQVESVGGSVVEFVLRHAHSLIAPWPSAALFALSGTPLLQDRGPAFEDGDASASAPHQEEVSFTLTISIAIVITSASYISTPSLARVGEYMKGEGEQRKGVRGVTRISTGSADRAAGRVERRFDHPTR